MRATRAVPALICAMLLAVACDAPPDPANKDMAAPGGTVEPGRAPAPEPQMAEAPAEHDHEETGGRLEAHEHGRATLAAAVDGNELTFSFEAPLASLVGFEHAPETDAQTEALNTLKDVFVVPGSMVAVNPSAGCLPLMTTSGTHFGGGHGALEVEHVYTCESADRIDSIEFLLMDRYPQLESIDAIFLSGTRQSAGELRPGSPALKVR